ncbi:MAG: T9SS type A sorting domain-containing protein, partial [Bacteroidota bacterium]
GMAVQGAAAQKLEEMNPTLALTAYPNPTMTATTVSVTPVDKGEYSIVLTDMTGRVIAEVFNGFISDFENRTFDVDMSALTGGIYVVNVIGSNGIMDNLKIVKE